MKALGMMDALAKLSFLGVFLTILGSVNAALDPCSSYMPLDDVFRSPKYQITQGKDAICDDKLIEGWYRFTGIVGGMMPETKPDINHCGTSAPIWMREPHPTNVGEVKEVTACTNVRNMMSGCLLSHKISVKNCGSFFVYKLKKVYGCSRAYCAGDKKPCPRGQIGLYPNCTEQKWKVNCDPSFMEVELKRSSYSHIDHRNFHLIDDTCRVTSVTSNFVRIRFPLSSCGTNYTERYNHLEFWNQVNADHRYRNPNETISRYDPVILRFHCFFFKRQLMSTSFIPSKQVLHVSDKNFGNFTFNMHLFRSGKYKNRYLPFEYPVAVKINEPIWIEYKVQDPKNGLAVFADNCRATTSTDPNSSPQYEFLKDGCALDSTMNYKYDPTSSVQQFSIKSFRFIYTNSKLVYLHCELLVCLRNSTNSRCSQGCLGSRRRRAADYEATSDRHDLSVGPFEGKSENVKGGVEDSKGMNSIMVAGIGVVGGLLVVAIALLVAFKIYPMMKERRRRSTPETFNDINSYDNKGIESGGNDDGNRTENQPCEVQVKM